MCSCVGRESESETVTAERKKAGQGRREDGRRQRQRDSENEIQRCRGLSVLAALLTLLGGVSRGCSDGQESATSLSTASRRSDPLAPLSPPAHLQPFSRSYPSPSLLLFIASRGSGIVREDTSDLGWRAALRLVQTSVFGLVGAAPRAMAATRGRLD
eukprot:3680058-Rhodomonas_salina.1